ncbi:MAG: NADH-quinone oxidoreductase subunit J [Acidimicrobiia bacterium]|nr:NADH-quinone oxidoreductase subunit J [Acidimicrobiia bacterium]
MEIAVFAVCAVIVIGGALGVIVARHPVYAALSLVATLFGVAVLFLTLDAPFLAAVQVIVYAGAIVVLFLFVIMLLGVDRAENLRTEPLGGQRPLAGGLGVATLVLALLFAIAVGTGGFGDGSVATGAPAAVAPERDSCTGLSKALEDSSPLVAACDGTEPISNIRQVARWVFTDYVWAFQLTGLLLTVAVVGAVVLARGRRGADGDDEAAGPAPDTAPEAV